MIDKNSMFDPKDVMIDIVIRQNCPICNSDCAPRFKLDQFDVMYCNVCDFQFVRSIRSASSISMFYENGYDNIRHIHGQQVNASVNINVLAKLVPEISHKTLLDIGSGYGFFLKMSAKVHKITGTGVELSHAERKYAKDILKIKTYNDIKSLPKKIKYDVVTAFEVIEHVADPVEFVRSLIDFIKIDGYLIIATDNFSSGVVRSLGEGFPKWIPHEHISYFNSNSIVQLMKKFDQLHYVNSCSFTPWELELRSLVSCLSRGRYGKFKYIFSDFNGIARNKGYFMFGLRLLINSIWARLSMRKNLNGEMMYVCYKRIN